MPHHMGQSWEQYRRDFEKLDWSRGLTANDIRSQCPNCPPEMFQGFPSGQTFHSFQEFWNMVSSGAGMKGRMGSEGGSSRGT